MNPLVITILDLDQSRALFDLLSECDPETDTEHAVVAEIMRQINEWLDD